MTPGVRPSASNSAPASGRDRIQSCGDRPPGVGRRLSKYRAIFAAQISHNLAYPAEVVARGLIILVFLWVFSHLWRATYGSTGQSSIAGFTLSDTLWYLMLAEAIVLSKPRHAEKIAASVRDGTIAHLLSKPYSYLAYQASVGLADSVLPFAFNVIVGGALVWAMMGPPPDPRVWPFVLIVVLAAWLLDFCITSLIGLSAFVTEDVSAFIWIYAKFVLIIGGVLMPLDFMPVAFRNLALMLPIPYTVYGPAKLFVAFSPESFVRVLAIQVVWLTIMGSGLILAYRRGVAWLTINGG